MPPLPSRSCSELLEDYSEAAYAMTFCERGQGLCTTTSLFLQGAG